MLIGIIGAPNKGKSTLFSAMTMNDVAIADYPFTTIDPNRGVAYATADCAERRLNLHCNARNSLCTNGVRMIPVNVIDVAGLVEGAHEGRGMGNQFLNDMAASDAFILVVDASGKTDASGNKAQGGNPVQDAETVISELHHWLSGIIKAHIRQITHSRDGIGALEAVLTGLKIPRSEIEAAIVECGLPSARISWDSAQVLKFSAAVLKRSKPLVIAANKADSWPEEAHENIRLLKERFGAQNVFECSAAVELALRKAAASKVIEYLPDSTSFRAIKSEISKEQAGALEYMLSFLRASRYGTGVQHLLNSVVFCALGNIVVYPVEDEHKCTDHFGNVLPDAVLLRQGSTALDLASAVHTDIAKGMLYAVDAVKHMRIGREQQLHDGDVVKIVSAAR